MADMISDRLAAASRVSEALSQQSPQEKGGRRRRRPQPPAPEPEADLETPDDTGEPPHKVDSLA